MGIIGRKSPSLQDRGELEYCERTFLDAGLGRCEAVALTPAERPVDPYDAWLKRRGEEGERERPRIRWVCRNPATSRDGEDRLVGSVR